MPPLQDVAFLPVSTLLLRWLQLGDLVFMFPELGWILLEGRRRLPRTVAGGQKVIISASHFHQMLLLSLQVLRWFCSVLSFLLLPLNHTLKIVHPLLLPLPSSVLSVLCLLHVLLSMDLAPFNLCCFSSLGSDAWHNARRYSYTSSETAFKICPPERATPRILSPFVLPKHQRLF